MRGIMGRRPPSVAALRRFDVNVRTKVESLWQPLYDYAVYAAAGQTQLVFFQNPVGQAGKTRDDTNMEAAGQMPAPKQFLLQGISIDFTSGVVPGTLGAQAAAGYVNDVHAIMKSGHLTLTIGSKEYLVEGPVGKFPPEHGLQVSGALADVTTAGANLQSMIQFARFSGGVYEVTPTRIPSNQNFDVKLNWNTAVALPSTVAGRIGVTLHGFQYRRPQ